jgi:hypothetical protein
VQVQIRSSVLIEPIQNSRQRPSEPSRNFLRFRRWMTKPADMQGTTFEQVQFPCCSSSMVRPEWTLQTEFDQNGLCKQRTNRTCQAAMGSRNDLRRFEWRGKFANWCCEGHLLKWASHLSSWKPTKVTPLLARRAFRVFHC